MMHMAHAGLTTLNTGKNKKKLNAKQLKAKAEHEAWLKSKGVHSEQIAKRKSNIKTEVKVESISKPTVKSLGNGFAPIAGKKSVFDSAWKKMYDDPELEQREAIARKAAEEKKSRIAPAFSKGAYQYISDGTSLADIGKKK